jgi:hypothetical protein
MSKMLPATCAGGIVTAEGVPVPAAEILSKGTGPSSGILILDEDKAYYVAQTSPDLDAALAQVITALGQAVTALQQTALTFTATFAGMTGPTTAPPPTGPAGVVAIGVAVAAITAAQVQLQTLKEVLK